MKPRLSCGWRASWASSHTNTSLRNSTSSIVPKPSTSASVARCLEQVPGYVVKILGRQIGQHRVLLAVHKPKKRDDVPPRLGVVTKCMAAKRNAAIDSSNRSSSQYRTPRLNHAWPSRASASSALDRPSSRPSSRTYNSRFGPLCRQSGTASDDISEPIREIRKQQRFQTPLQAWVVDQLEITLKFGRSVSKSPGAHQCIRKECAHVVPCTEIEGPVVKHRRKPIAFGLE